MYAGARSHLQLREYGKALDLFILLKEEVKKGSDSPRFHLEVYRGLARCYEGLDRLADAETTYIVAKDCFQEEVGLAKERALVKLELASVHAKLHEDQTSSLAMLFDVLKDLLLHAAIGGRMEYDKVLSEYDKYGCMDV